jgi:prephenate dehydrogenase
MKILIVGGTGDFGAFYAKLFKEEGHKVGISSRSEEKGKKFCEENNFTFSNSPKGYDIVILSVPNESAPKNVEDIIPLLDEGALLVDLCSVKSHIVPILKNFKDKNIELASIHPMHGPRVKSLKEIPIVFIPIKAGEKYNLLKKFFKSKSDRVFDSNMIEHDKILSIVQGLTHYTQFVASNVLAELNLDLEKTLKFASPNYSLFISLATRVMVQNPQLYSQIQLENPNNESVRELFSKKSNELEEICKGGKKVLEENITKTKEVFKNSEKLLLKSDKMTEVCE